ncbi:MAG: sulfite exporter TauE/SafE family protein [Oscillospiraceae bacterium]
MMYLILSLVGLLSGITASLGIGGGFVLLLYLTVITNMPQREAQLINLIFFLPIAIVSILLHIRNKLIVKDVVMKSVIGGILGVFVGVYIATILPNEFISKAFAIFVLIVGIKELFAKKKNR